MSAIWKKIKDQKETPQCQQWLHCIAVHCAILVMENFKTDSEAG